MSAPSLFDYEPSIRFLRERGCRCNLMWDGVSPVPHGCCEIGRGEPTQCWFIDALILARTNERMEMMARGTSRDHAP